jgi:hypothetical protein
VSVVSRTRQKRDPLEQRIEAALAPGRFISYRAGWDFVAGLEEAASDVEALMRADPARAVKLCETFLAGCYEKAEELDDSSGNFGLLVDRLYRGWIQARQATKADPEETARILCDRMDDDPYGFAYDIEHDALPVMDKQGRAAFERQARTRFEATLLREGERSGVARLHPDRRRWGEVLRFIYLQRRNVKAYAALCEETELRPQDCHAMATMLRARRHFEDALAWVERGLGLEAKSPHRTMASDDLAQLKRDLLTKLGRTGDALEDAWAAFQEHPSAYGYGDLMRYVPRAERAAWHARAMNASERTDLESLIELWLETKETERLVGRLRDESNQALENLSHHAAEPVATRLAKSHPEVAAKVYRALGLGILNAGKSRQSHLALSNLEHARRCYARAGLPDQWKKVIEVVRRSHHRKVGFMADFERLVAGRGASDKLSFLDRARRRWLRGAR